MSVLDELNKVEVDIVYVDVELNLILLYFSSMSPLKGLL